VLLISAGLLFQALRSALHPRIGDGLGTPLIAIVRAAPDTAQYFRDIEREALSMYGISQAVWTGTLPGGRPSWSTLRMQPRQPPLHETRIHPAALTPDVLSEMVMPPIAGRMFGASDRPDTCRVGVINEPAAKELFDGEAVGHSIEDPSGQRIEIIGVVRMQPRAHALHHDVPTIYYYPEQTAPPVDEPGPARFRAPLVAPPSEVVLDSRIASSSYFQAMGLRRAEGELFTDEPTTTRACRVGVVNQKAADLYFGGNAVGAAVIDAAGLRTEIVGVVQAGDAGGFLRNAEPAIYLPLAQNFRPGMTMILGAREPTDALLKELARRLAAVPGGGAPVTVRRLSEHFERTALAPLRIATVLIGSSAVIALGLAVLGLYGTLTDSARQRKREIAIRLALGAQGWRLVRQVVGEGTRLVVAGGAAGMAAAFFVARLLARIAPASESFGGGARMIWIAVPASLAIAVVIASILPARRSLGVDPLTITRDS
jgi:hypothetical protein